MTRINVGINPRNLHQKHLLAEHREIIRIPNAITKGRAVVKNIPEKFSLGRGSVKFFYNKLGYLLARYIAIHTECKKRGFNVKDYSSSWDNVPLSLRGFYQPTRRDIQIIKKRIKERKPK